MICPVLENVYSNCRTVEIFLCRMNGGQAQSKLRKQRKFASAFLQPFPGLRLRIGAIVKPFIAIYSTARVHLGAGSWKRLADDVNDSDILLSQLAWLVPWKPGQSPTFHYTSNIIDRLHRSPVQSSDCLPRVATPYQCLR